MKGIKKSEQEREAQNFTCRQEVCSTVVKCNVTDCLSMSIIGSNTPTIFVNFPNLNKAKNKNKMIKERNLLILCNTMKVLIHYLHSAVHATRQ